MRAEKRYLWAVEERRERGTVWRPVDICTTKRIAERSAYQWRGAYPLRIYRVARYVRESGE